MKQISLTTKLEKQDITKLIKRYHFSDEDFSKLNTLYEAFSPLLNIIAYYEYNLDLPTVDYKNYYTVLITLGKNVDIIQDLYSKNHCISEEYMLECIANELLLKSYEECINFLQHETKNFAKQLDFLGDKYPIDLFPDIAKYFPDTEITYNKQLVLSPKKSVVFFLPMGTVKKLTSCNICSNCGNKDCVLRQTTYQVEPVNNQNNNINNPILSKEFIGSYGMQTIFSKKP